MKPDARELREKITGAGLMLPETLTLMITDACNLICPHCLLDCKNIKGKSVHIDIITSIIDEFSGLGGRRLLITGGEPLLQREELHHLLTLLKDFSPSMKITIETNGSFVVPIKWPVDCWVVDYKLRSSGQKHKMWIYDRNFLKLRKQDFIKFVIGSYDDYDDAIHIMESFIEEGCRCRFAFSPILSEFSAERLINRLSFDELFNVIVNIQIHKLIDVP